ncbi:MAG: DUF3823 domain-containing protein [Chitinophagaceae bacterium]|nr:MAG: DUF3823 domain-containing protein [Chitinophagaceae bacterium]
MKKILFYTLAVTMFGGLASCKKDNYDAPSSTLTGRLMYQGTPVEVEHNQVSFDLFEYGFGSLGPIGGTFQQDGSYSHLLFDGDYKMVIRPEQGPFVINAAGKVDSISIQLRGNQELNIEVVPYYMIRNAQITGNATTANATFNLDKIISGTDERAIDRVVFFINKTTFVSANDQIASTTIQGADLTSMTGITMSVPIPSITPTQNYVFGRVGVKIAGVEDWLLSSVVRIQF